MSAPENRPGPRPVEHLDVANPSRNRLTAWVRTVVPGVWSALVAWLVTLGLPPAITSALAGLVDQLVVPVALAAVYALLRWLEPRLPRWLAVVLIGSPRTPTYT